MTTLLIQKTLLSLNAFPVFRERGIVLTGPNKRLSLPTLVKKQVMLDRACKGGENA